ncbi:acyl-CoA dehydrogenase [Leptospira perolatii]|uniref:Acyl-CoA dehydrogenase n=1 Tax=Leptospira perolatii TaxID=2023191 RepID=A0A2M9ZK52_9LEPT|nr:acyl-CoA dehydrogenase [Leptospira perolatii]PJZ72323.1 acyl-CoA dehydrogenase [Leptospira perolatii]
MDELAQKLSSIPSEEFRSVYKLSLPVLQNAGLLDALSGGSFKEFHTKLSQIPLLPHGIGVGVGLMAQTNIAGKILRLTRDSENSFAKQETREIANKILNRLTDGLEIASFGVSESGWMGRIQNIQSVAKRLPSGEYELSFEKGFLTNGADAENFFIVLKGEADFPYGIFYIPRNIPGLKIEEFHLEFAKEATHCKLSASNLIVPSSYLFLPDYSAIGPDVHLSEMLSAAVLFCGSIRKIVYDLASRSDSREIMQNIERLWDLSGLLLSKCLEISEKKDQSKNYRIEEDHPYGYETTLDLCTEILDSIPDYDRKKEFPDFELFLSIHPTKSPVYFKNRLKQARSWKKGKIA